MRALALILFFATLGPAADNTLTPAERRDGWKLLFDGHSLEGWMWSMDAKPPAPCWKAENGTLRTTPGEGVPVYLLTRETFTDFELTFEWKVEEKGNSGIKYRVQAYGRGNRLEPTGLEYQMIDDERNPDALSTPKHTTGAVYDYVAPVKTGPALANAWHTSRILARGLHLEHWLDGTRVVNIELDSEDARAQFATSKRGSAQMLLKQERRDSPIALQMHDGAVWFRNLKIRRL